MEKLNTKKAVIDQILLWMVLLIAFISIFFIVIDYATIARLKTNTDLISKYAARMIALDKNKVDIATTLNSIKVPYFDDITSADFICTKETPTTGVNEYKVTLEVSAAYSYSIVLDFNDTIVSKVSTFNEIDEDFVDCKLALRAK